MFPKKMVHQYSTSIFIFSLVFISFIRVNSLDLNEVLQEREKILADEDKRFLGGTLTLNSAEQLANSVLMKAKTDEYDSAFLSADFTPAHHFFQAKPAMLRSQVYQFIRSMPKGFIIIASISYLLKTNK